MRPAIAMIEMIFAIVIMAIALISIPSMLNVAEESSKISIIDDDVMSRMMGWIIDKSQARWDANYSASGSPILWISNTADLNCTRGNANMWYRDNNQSTVQCHEQNLSASVIPSLGDGNLSHGIEQLNGGSETLSVTASSGEAYEINASYAVQYVTSTINSGTANNRKVATWRLGSSTAMVPDGSLNTTTHLKRIVTRFHNDNLGINTTLTFFKSNKGN